MDWTLVFLLGFFLKLNKALCGLERSPRIWNEIFDEAVKNAGFDYSVLMTDATCSTIPRILYIYCCNLMIFFSWVMSWMWNCSKTCSWVSSRCVKWVLFKPSLVCSFCNRMISWSSLKRRTRSWSNKALVGPIESLAPLPGKRSGVRCPPYRSEKWSIKVQGEDWILDVPVPENETIHCCCSEFTCSSRCNSYYPRLDRCHACHAVLIGNNLLMYLLQAECFNYLCSEVLWCWLIWGPQRQKIDQWSYCLHQWHTNDVDEQESGLCLFCKVARQSKFPFQKVLKIPSGFSDFFNNLGSMNRYQWKRLRKTVARKTYISQISAPRMWSWDITSSMISYGMGLSTFSTVKPVNL